MDRLPADDNALWRRVVRDVAPLRGRRSPDPAPPAPSPASGGEQGWGKAAAGTAWTNRAARDAPPLEHAAGVDRATAERLKRGRFRIEARLDLHGMTQAEAHRALAGFVAGSRAAGRRCVLVITGHGRLSGGILKAAVPRWLGEAELRHHMLAIAPARPQDGGSGALYLLLRRLPH